MEPLVQVEGLRVIARKDGREAPIVKDVGFSIPKGEVLALIGESGSGKTTIALALLGYARRGCRIAGGSIRIGGTRVLELTPGQLYELRGRKVSYIAQSAAAAFNPMKTIMDQVIEGALIHGTSTRAEAEAKAVDLFAALALPDPEGIGSRYPHQVSGGQLQRLMAAMALITDPELVVLDEPTTALDVTTQIEVLRAFKKVVRERGATAVYVSHDLAVVAQMADRILVLSDGEMRETGATAQILARPRHPYTRSLLAAAAPQVRGEGEPRGDAPLLEIRGLVAGYGRPDASGMPAARVLDNVDLAIARGSTLGVIGESGSGKTTLARVVAGLVPAARGTVLFDGKPLPTNLKERTREQFRRIQIVFQNADTVLNPAHSVERILARPLAFYHGVRGEEARKRVARLLDLVKLPAALAARRPAELSGGQKQRVNLARALAAEPDLVLCDEVTSALDTIVGAAVLDLLAELRRELGVSLMFISHDISTVRAVCDQVMVLYSGCKVDAGSRKALASPPFHPYADLLIASVPELRTGWLDGLPARLAVESPPPGAEKPARGLCTFLDRCPVRIAGVCDREPPPRRDLGGGKEILCHHTRAELEALQTA
ncbi:MAG TPA: ABC transporter ATP-binding protein [Usitatibacter sp.]|jgi:peptide/nickel transport system ATP-binding protein|nr:ABC transporter ATP-binding protein [Usitatibacter sp.]